MIENTDGASTGQPMTPDARMLRLPKMTARSRRLDDRLEER
jgi:hypothetical protein